MYETLLSENQFFLASIACRNEVTWMELVEDGSGLLVQVPEEDKQLMTSSKMAVVIVRGKCKMKNCHSVIAFIFIILSLCIATNHAEEGTIMIKPMTKKNFGGKFSRKML